MAKINAQLGILNWVTGHNTLDKLDTQFLAQDGAYTHIEADNGMAPKFGGKGGYVLLGPQGINMRGFESDASNEVVTAPASGTNVHIGLPAGQYLNAVLTHLFVEGKDGGVIKVKESRSIKFSLRDVAKDKVLAMMENAMRYLEWVNASATPREMMARMLVLLMLDSELGQKPFPLAFGHAGDLNQDRPNLTGKAVCRDFTQVDDVLDFSAQKIARGGVAC